MFSSCWSDEELLEPVVEPVDELADEPPVAPDGACCVCGGV
jgi:hypothetical protein